jgi:hypothetical protein
MMDLTKILAISGKPGLFKMLSQTKSGFVVESLTDGKRFQVFPHERVSSLEEISIFTTGEDDIPLKDVFRKLFEKFEGKPGPDPKADDGAVKKMFEETIPDYDTEKVYVSDMKKAFTWYNMLLEKGMMEFSEEEKEEDKASAEEPVAGKEITETKPEE